jgi:hypothetical protein
MRQRRPASAALTVVAGTRPAVRCTQMLARTPKRDSTPSACSDVWFIGHLDWHAAGAQASASVAHRVVRLDRGAGHRSSLRTQRPPSRSRWTHTSSFERLQQYIISPVVGLTHASAAAGQRRADSRRGHAARRPLHADVSAHPEAGFNPVSVQRCPVHLPPRLARCGGSGTRQRGTSRCSPGSWCWSPIVPAHPTPTAPESLNSHLAVRETPTTSRILCGAANAK